MNRASTIMIWVAVILFFGAYIFPLWSISLDAPQYPEGMGMKIWISTITGGKPYDLQNINGLNHYIGMKQIHADAIPELRFMKFIVAGLILLGISAGVTRKRAVLAAWVVLSIVVALAGLVDFYKWGYDYGHDLNPEAPIKVPGMTYQPPLIGVKQLLNITATSLPALGGLLLIVAVGLAFFALIVDWKRPGHSGKQRAPRSLRSVATVIVAALIWASCSPGPSPIHFGTDTCDHCRMTITQEQYGCEIVTTKGRVYKFDSIECMASTLDDKIVEDANVHATYTIDHEQPRTLIEATGAAYVHSVSLRSPMGMNLTSFADRAAAERALARREGEVLTWEEARRLVRDAAGGASN